MASSATTSLPRPLPLRREWRWVGGRIFDVAFSPTDDATIATAQDDCSLIWSALPGSAPSPIKQLAAPSCLRCAWHGAGQHVLTGGTNGLVTVWSVAEEGDGKSLASLNATEYVDADDDESTEIYGLELITKEMAVVACHDVVQQWDLPRASLTARTQLATYDGGVAFGGARNPSGTSFVFSLAARGRVLAAAVSDGTCRLLDSQTCKEVLPALDDHAQRGAAVFGVALSPTLPLLATAAADGRVFVHDLRKLTSGPLLEVRGHTQAVHACAFAPAGSLGAAADSGELLVTGSADCTMRIHETRAAHCVGAVRSSAPVLCAAVGGAKRGGGAVAAGGGSGQQDNALAIFSAATSLPAAAARREREAHDSPPMAAAEGGAGASSDMAATP